ncbi:hybrid sensor histidine kinase/response regulator [Paenibacillus solanacearum]|nr:ATP-binding protein [Paenibacillus solanacearum]
MMTTTNRSLLKYIAVMLAFLSLLLGLRWAWFDMFAAADHPRAVRGVLDLRGWDLQKSPSIHLDGEWDFSPGKLLSYPDIASAEAAFRPIQVPGNWSGALPEDPGSPIGFGTYRLRILIDPLEQPVSLWLQNIEAASRVEINGMSEGEIGRPAGTASEYTPMKMSFTSTYTVKGQETLEVLIQAANFDNPYQGGILRSIRFGSQASIDYVRWYSIGFQLVTFILLLLHGLYACILYLFNRHEKALLIVSLLTLTTGIAVMAGYDNLLLLWLPINYAWGLKIRLLALLWHSYFILLLFRKFAAPPANHRWFQLFTAMSVAFSVGLTAASAAAVHGIVEYGLFSLFYLVPFVWFVYTAGTMIFGRQTDADNIFLLLSAIGIISSLLWSLWNSHLTATLIYYPVDIMAAIIGFAAYWFKKYFRQARENAQLTEQLKRTDKLKDQFLANTSHELRTPLHGMMNIAETVMTREKDRLHERSHKDMELLITISRRMSHMLGDLLDVARLQEHRIVLRQEPVHIQSVAPGVIGMLEYMAQGKRIELRMDIAESMPPVLADEKRLVQILYNLLHNALKYTDEGSISVFAEWSDDEAFIHVADTGVGMDESTQSRVFLRYEQGAYGMSNGRGIGLGLSICKQRVELHGGTLTVRSAPGQGSVFRFGLPLAGASKPAVVPPSPGLAEDRPPPHAADACPEDALANAAMHEWAATVAVPPLLLDAKLNILAVDDDPVNLNVLVGILSSEPYTITTANSARDALDLLGTGQWDLLIADVMMPHMSGYELTRRVREHYSLSELPVLLLTARSQPADIYTGFQSGASDYVTKPVDAVELKYRIRALIGLKQSINERLRMEAAYLQAQIHPHFLFNTLNSIMALSIADPDKMRKLADAFASFLRISFDFLNTGQLVELTHELKLAEAYLYIEKARFEDRLTVVWDVEPGIHLRLPPLSIQPLIENAVKHGLLSQNKGGTVHIRIAGEKGFTRIEVKDNGKGIEPDKIAQLLTPTFRGKRGIGLANTNRRLIQLYGQGLSIVSKPNDGTVVSFVIPDDTVAPAAPQD